MMVQARDAANREIGVPRIGALDYVEIWIDTFWSAV
jgi:hypothetical protein